MSSNSVSSKPMTNKPMSYKHWRIDRDDNNIVWLHFDMLDVKANLLSQEAIAELYDLLDSLSDDQSREKLRGIVICSDKQDSFIFGADIREFTTLDDLDQATLFLQNGHDLMNKLEAMACPTVAMIHGFCLGGGTELSLACDYIVASDDRRTRIGLPEIKLGIFPGYGGSVRSVQRCGPLPAMDMMLTGRMLQTRAAKKIGLIDEMVPYRQLHRAAEHFALNAPKRKKLPLIQRLANTALLRPLVASQMRKQVRRKAQPQHYPAPYALIELWQKHAGNSKRMLEEEIRTVARLATTDTARNLVRVFFLQEKLKAQGKQTSFDVQHVHVIGGGIMGGDIASWCAIQGFTTSVQDQSPERLAATVKRAQESFRKKFKRDRRAIRDANDRLIPDHKGDGIHRADIVIEAIFEDCEVKRELYRSIEPKMKQSALLATNTSSIRLEDLSSALQRPERLVGLHFFNPVALMPLVEIIRGENSSELAVQQALAFGKDISKLPLAVKSSPGFLVNRILMPYILEAVTMVDEGIPAEAIDKAATGFGMPMGPIELADTVGLDICKHVAEILSAALDIQLPDNIKSIDDRKLGKKTGEGFYVWNKGKPVKNKSARYNDMQKVQDRLVMRLLNEAVICKREGIVDDDELIDAGVIFGTGFAPFTGGPIQYAKDKGIENILSTMNGLQSSLGDRFKPDEEWGKIQ